MASADLTGAVLDIDGLLGPLVQFAEEVSLCRLEATAATIANRIYQLSTVPCQSAAPWALTLARHGLRVALEPGCQARCAHRTMKRLCCGALRDVYIALPPEPLLLSPASLRSLEGLAESFWDASPHWPGGKQLIQFVFDPEEVYSLGGEGRPLRSSPVWSSSQKGYPDDPKRSLTMHLELNCRLAFAEDQLEPAIFLDLCLSEKMPEFTWVQVMLWGSMDDLDQSHKPELSVFRLLSRGSSTMGLGRLREGSTLRAAASSHGALHAMVAFAPYSSVEPPKCPAPAANCSWVPHSGDMKFMYRCLRLMQWFFNKLH